VEVRWSGEALADLEGIQDYLIKRNPAAALRMVKVLRQAAARLSQFPERGRPGRWPGTRELVVSRTPYILPYRVKSDAVEVLRVFHNAQRWPRRPAST
jgi:addiction module RelE/StbE family toxin